MNSDKIRVSEIFHSIQGEGNTSGMPSVFLRLTGCNLMCGGQGTERDKELHNEATWRCDTIEVWRSGVDWGIHYLANHLVEQYGDALRDNSQLVITGGEPLSQQMAYEQLLSEMRMRIGSFRVEVETNGTLIPWHGSKVQQYNISPKLANSGMPYGRRVKEIPLQHFAELVLEGRAIFKFVITRPEDLSEVMDDYLLPFQIPKSKVWLMPGCSNREQYEKVAPMVAATCMEHGFNFSSRLQINVWNETTGV